MELKVADLQQRFVAFLNTFLIVAVFMCVIAFLVRVTMLDDDVTAIALVYGIPVFVVVVFGAQRRGTIGMRMGGLRFGDVSGAPISFSRCAARIFTGAVLLPVLPVSIVVCLCDGRGRTLADLICGTMMWAEPTKAEKAVRPGFVMGPLETREHI